MADISTITLPDGNTYNLKDTRVTSASTTNAGIVQLGQDATQAYPGDKGAIAYNHAINNGSSFSSGLYKITTNDQGHVISATLVKKSDITALGIPASDTNTEYTLNTTTANFTTAAAVTIAANGSGTLNFTNGTAPSGYTAISIRYLNTGSVNLPIVTVNITGGVVVRNVSGSSITIAKGTNGMTKEYIRLKES